MKNKIILLITFCLLLSACHKKTKKIAQMKYPVALTVAEQKDTPIFIENIGHVESIIKVDIRSRVEGQLESINFTPGDDVKVGDILFVIDPKPFEADLQKAQATLLENIANLNLAKDKLKRNKELYKKEYISELDFDTLITNVKIYESIVDQNRAEVEVAKLNLNYCYILSPINGMAGILNIDLGNLIGQDSQKSLTTINQIKPIYVVFSVPEKNIPSIKKYEKSSPLKVQASFDNFQTSIEGSLKIINNQVDEKTASITLKALYDNDAQDLLPGQFINIRLILTIEKDAILIPDQAVQHTPKGPVVFIVEKNNSVQMRNVILGQRQDGTVIIKKGVEKGEKVVTKGQINLVNGALVFETPL